MKITRPAIEQALASISLPGAGKNLMEANAVKNIHIFGDEVVVDVETDNPALQAKKKTEVSIMKTIHDQVNEKAKVKVNISVKAVKKKDANLIKGKPIEGIQHIIAVASGNAKGEVAEIWITFPDPQYKFRRKHHRLTNPTFLRSYQQILQPEGVVHLKTDAAFLHGYTLGVLDGWDIKPQMAHHDIYGYVHAPADVIGIQTFYEQQYRAKGIPITYLKFSFPTDATAK